ncbi:DNA-methyltransferase [Deinococcota bacterium DY0809b]
MNYGGDLIIKRVSPIPQELPSEAISAYHELGQRAIPRMAKDKALVDRLVAFAKDRPSKHSLLLGDSRKRLVELSDASVHLAVTSPPYWTLKKYENDPNQLGAVRDYERFLQELDIVWREVFRLLVPGGRLVVVVGDVNIPRKDPAFKRHVVFPLHASIQEHARKLGFDNLAPIIWHKIANARFEAGGGGFYGKPYEPGAIIKNDVEYILFFRKPGGYRSPTAEQRLASIIPEEEHRAWFQQIWTLSGASTKDHPAPFPLSLAERLVRMYSFVGDTVLDPFMGTGTTNLAALRWGRNSVGIELIHTYFNIAAARLLHEPGSHIEASFAEKNTNSLQKLSKP